MAASSAGLDPDDTQCPGVSISDTEKCCTIFLKAKNLQVKKKHGLFGALEATNGDVKVNLDTEEVDARITVKDGAGKSTVFEYKKKLPEEIDAKKSKWEIFKAERIKIELYKVKPERWERHVKHLQSSD